MLSIIICNYNNNRISNIKQNISENIGGILFELIIIDNSNNVYSIFQAYNIGINKSKGDHLLFIHDDIEFRTINFGEILMSLNLSNLGVLGIAGSKIKTKISSPWWISNHERIPEGVLFQFIIQHFKNSKPQLINWGFNKSNQVEEVLLVDGVFLFSTKENLLKHPFNENYNSFHFYDLDLSLNLYNSGKINYVTNAIQIEHFSSGSLNKQWVKSSKLFSNNWSMGVYNLVDRKISKSKFEKLAFNSHFETLLENKFYFEIFKLLILNPQYISVKIYLRLFKTVFNG